MYYIINITDDKDGMYRGETFMFPVLKRANDIISGKLTLKDELAVNLSKRYDILFEVIESENISYVIKQCAKNIFDAHNSHFLKPVIGVFANGAYNKDLTTYFKSLDILNVEPLTAECKI